MNKEAITIRFCQQQVQPLNLIEERRVLVVQNDDLMRIF